MRPIPSIQTVALTMLALLSAAASAGAQALGTLSSARPIVVVDAGHGGDEPGVVDGELVEKDLTLRLAFVVAEEMVARGYDVRLTRDGDFAVSMDDRRAIAEGAGAQVLLMLHVMAREDPAARGAEMYVAAGMAHSGRLADRVEAEVRGDGRPLLRRALDAPALASPRVASVALEVAHMTNPEERPLVTSRAFYRAVAESLADAVEGYLTGG